MFRRSRFSVRPNVGTAGRTAATPQEAPSANQDPSETPNVGENISIPAVSDNKPPPEKNTNPGDGSDQAVEGSSSSAAVQRRKRFSVKPKVAPGRPAPTARTPKSPVKSASEAPGKTSGSNDKPTTPSQPSPTASSQPLGSPRRRRPSEDTKQAKVQPKPTHIPPEGSAPLAVHPPQDSSKQTPLPGHSGKQLDSTSGSQVKETPSRGPTFVLDKEAIELSEKAKSLVSKSKLTLSSSALSLSRLLNDPSDIQRLAKAQKLKELLREERHKERTLKKAKTRVKEYTLDPAKMTMRDLIRYVPLSNPMTSSLESSTQEDETVVPTSPERDKFPETAQQPEVTPKIINQSEGENEEEEAEQDEEMMVPRVKVAEDGSLIIDEESLTVEVQRAKGPNPAQDRDPIFERGSTTTYSSFRKGTSSKPWSSEETDMFFLAVSMVGTDFSMICQLFPHRARSEIKNKFKKEERENSWRVDKAFKERRKLDIEYFSKLLEKILEYQKNRKKLRSLVEKNAPKKQRKRNTKAKKAARKLSDVEEEEDEDENLPDLEDEDGGEKENELLCNEGETTASKPMKQQKRKPAKDDSNKEPSNKKNKKDESISEQDKPSILEDTEEALSEDPKNSDMSGKTDNVDGKDAAVKPAKLSRGRAPKPLLPLGRKWGKKVPVPSKNPNDGGNENVQDGANNEVNKEASPSKVSANNENSSGEEDTPIPPPKPTRYGRVPKPTKLLAYTAKDEGCSSTSETTPRSPGQRTAPAAGPKPKNTAKRGRSSVQRSDQESKKPKLITLRASQSDYSDEEDEQQWVPEEDEEEQNPSCSPSKDNTVPAFVPASLRSPHSKSLVVEDTMEELYILADMPDVLGISQDALCPDASCEQAQNETGIAEPCEHQLDLLVDVIDFLSSEHTEVSEDESYNEAAQTLLTIGNLTNLFQMQQNPVDTQDHLKGTTSNSETNQQPDGEISSYEHDQGVTPCTEVANMEPQANTAGCGDNDRICTEQWTMVDISPNQQVQTACSTPQAKRGNSPIWEPEHNKSLRDKKLNSHPVASTINKSATESDSPEITPTCAPQDIKPTEELSYSTTESGAINYSHSFSEPCLEPVAQETESSKEKKQMRQDEIIDSSHYLTASDMSEPHFEQVQVLSNTGSFQGQEEGGQQSLASVITALESSSVSQKAACKASSTLQSRSRLQKVKPKPNLLQTSRAARSKPQATRNSMEKDFSSSLTPRTTTEVEPEPSCVTPSGGLISQGDSVTETSGGSSLENNNLSEANYTPSTEQTKTLSGLQVKEGLKTDCVKSHEAIQESAASVAPPVEVLQPRRSKLQKVKSKPNLPQTCKTARSKLEVSKNTETQDSSSPPTSKKAELEPQLSSSTPESTGSVSDLAPLSDLGSPLPTTEEIPIEKTVEDLHIPVKAESSSRPEPSETGTKVEAQPTLVPEKSSIGISSVSVLSLKSSTNKPIAELGTDTGFAMESSTASSETNAPQRKWRCVKVKPNLVSSTRSARSKLQPEGISDTSDQKHLNSSSKVSRAQKPANEYSEQPENKLTEQDGTNLSSVYSSCNRELLDPTKSVVVEMESDQVVSSDGITVAKPSFTDSDKNLGGAKPRGKTSGKDDVEIKSSSQVVCKEHVSTGAKLNTKLTDDSNLFSSTQSSPSTKSEIDSALTDCEYLPDLKGSGHQCLKSDSEDKGQDVTHQFSKSSETGQPSNNKLANSTNESQTLSSATSTSIGKACQRRGRLIKPKPNLGRSSQVPKVQNSTPIQSDSGIGSKYVDASSQTFVSDVSCKKEPVDGAVEQQHRSDVHLDHPVEQPIEQDTTPNASESSLPCLSQVPSTQIVSTSSSEGTQSHPCLTLFSDMLPEQVPSDPDEPFFILSLTEIPVCSSAEVADSAAEPLSYLHVTDASVRPPSSFPGEDLGAAAEGSLRDTPVLVSKEECGEKSCISVNDSGLDARTQEKDLKTPVDADEKIVQSPETVESENKTEIPTTKQRLGATRRGGKKQVKQTRARTKKAGKTLVVSTSQDSPHIQPIVLLEACDATTKAEGVVTEPQKTGSDQVDIEKESSSHAEDVSTGVPASNPKTRAPSSRTRKLKDSSVPSSLPPPDKADFTSPKMEAPRPLRNRCSKKMHVTPTPSPTKTPEEAPTPKPTTSQTQADPEPKAQPHRWCSTPTTGTSQRIDEVSAFQRSESSSIEEEPTSVSQYFLSDIFTEVEEG